MWVMVDVLHCVPRCPRFCVGVAWGFCACERICAVAISVALSCLLIAFLLLLRGVEVCCGTSSCEA